MKTFIVKVKDAEMPKEQNEEQIIECILKHLETLYPNNESTAKYLFLSFIFATGFNQIKYYSSFSQWLDHYQLEYLRHQGITDLISIHKIDKNHNIDKFFANRLYDYHDAIYKMKANSSYSITIDTPDDVQKAYPLTMLIVKDIAEKINTTINNNTKTDAELRTKLNDKLNDIFSNIQSYINMRIKIKHNDENTICDINVVFKKYFKNDEINAIVRKISSTLRTIFKHVKIEHVDFYKPTTSRKLLNVVAKCNEIRSK